MSRQAKLKALAKPLLERNPDLVQLGDMIVMKPLKHILRTIYIGRTRTADMFHPVWAIYPLCFPNDSRPYSLGVNSRSTGMVSGCWTIRGSQTTSTNSRRIRANRVRA